MRLSLVEYKKRKESLMNGLHLSDKEFTELVRGDYEDGVSKVASRRIKQLMSKKWSIPTNGILDDFDMVWFYKRNLHIITPEIESFALVDRGIDTSCLNKLDKDIDIDTIVCGKPVYARLIHRNIPVKFKTVECYWTIDAYGEGWDMHYSFKGGDVVRKIFVDSRHKCVKCKSCNVATCSLGVKHSIRPCAKQECKLAKEVVDPILLLGLCTEVADVYVNRQKIVKSKRSEDAKRARDIMIAREESTGDTERVMSMFEYVKEYQESERHEWKGGHHASPVSHPVVGTIVNRESALTFLRMESSCL